MRTQFVASQGQLVLFFGNKHNGRLERVIATVPPSAEFEFQLTPVPTTLEAGQQMTVRLLLPSQPPGCAVASWLLEGCLSSTDACWIHS